MAINIKGVPVRKLFPKTVSENDNGFKIYAFLPDNTKDLDINEYGNITIKGIIPDLLLNKEYEFEVEYESKNGRSAYVVEKVLSSMKPTSGDEAMTYLCEVTSVARAQAILSVYPNIIDMVMNDKPIDTKNIKNVGDSTMKKIAEKIKGQFIYYDLIVEFKDYGLTMNQMKKLMGQYKSADVVRARMEKNPYMCLCSIAGIGFKTADEKILRKNIKFLKSTFRISEAIQYVLTQNEVNGNTFMVSDDLYAECKELVPECIDLFHRALEKSERVFVAEDRLRIAKTSTYLCEKSVAEMLLAIDSKMMPDQKEKPLWKNTKGNVLSSDAIPEAYKYIGDIKLTEDQQKVIPAVIDNNVVILAGYAGAGKSASCQALIEWLEANHKAYMLLAPTGRAASVLSGYTNRPASTIHRALGAKGDGLYEYNKDSKLFVDIVIVDEATMADVFLLKALLEALPVWTKILFVCDPAQIPSVGAGNVIQDMIRSKKFEIIMLDKVFRYGEGGLSYVATKTRKGDSYLNKEEDLQVFGTNEDYVFEQTEDENVISSAVKKYVSLHKSGISISDMVIVSCYNKGNYGTLAVNNMIQKIVNPPKDKNDGRAGYTKDGINILFNVGDRIMQTKNNYHVKKLNGDDEDDECTLYNGDFGIVEKITDDNSLICMFGENQVKIPKTEISDLLLGYSVSCHKMQGDNRAHIIFVTPKAHTFMLNRNLMYVALTRAKQKLYHYGNRDTVTKSLKKSENISRKTFLEGLLREL